MYWEIRFDEGAAALIPDSIVQGLAAAPKDVSGQRQLKIEDDGAKLILLATQEGVDPDVLWQRVAQSKVQRRAANSWSWRPIPLRFWTGEASPLSSH